MTAYIIRRLLMAVVIVILVTILVFFVIRLLPGDPLIIFMGQNAGVESMTPERLNQLRHDYGLDKPIMVQYFNWIGGILHGDLGRSITYRDHVSTLLKRAFSHNRSYRFSGLYSGQYTGSLAGRNLGYAARHVD